MAAKKNPRSRYRPAQKRPRWDESHLKMIFKLYPKTSNLELARRFGRSVQAVASLGHTFGLRKHRLRLTIMGRQNIARRWGKGRI